MRLLAYLGLIGISIYHILNIASAFETSLIGKGKIDNRYLLILLESVALSITTYLAYIIFQLHNNLSNKRISSDLKVGFILFAFTTIGNLFSEDLIEKTICSAIALFYTCYFYYELKKLKKEEIR